MLKSTDFSDISVSTGNLMGHIRLSRVGMAAAAAEKRLRARVMADMAPYIPRRTGALKGRLDVQNAMHANDGEVVVASSGRERALYEGISRSGRPIQYTNPLTTPRWFETARSVHGMKWLESVYDTFRRELR